MMYGCLHFKKAFDSDSAVFELKKKRLNRPKNHFIEFRHILIVQKLILVTDSCSTQKIEFKNIPYVIHVMDKKRVKNPN